MLVSGVEPFYHGRSDRTVAINSIPGKRRRKVGPDGKADPRMTHGHHRPGGLVRRSRDAERQAGRALIDVGRSRATGRSVPARLTPVAETTLRGRSRSTTSRHISPNEKPFPNHTKTAPRGAGPGRQSASARAQQKGPPLSSRLRTGEERLRPMRRRDERGYSPLAQRVKRPAQAAQRRRPQKPGSLSPATLARYLTREAI
jgi:hypothetical protein